MPEAWNFCPWCGHRTYIHTPDGCGHFDRKSHHCTDPQCGDSTWDHDCDYWVEDIPCDCKHSHDQLVVV